MFSITRPRSTVRQNVETGNMANRPIALKIRAEGSDHDSEKSEPRRSMTRVPPERRRNNLTKG
jgi:hypothetical protein